MHLGHHGLAQGIGILRRHHAFTGSDEHAEHGVVVVANDATLEPIRMRSTSAADLVERNGCTLHQRSVQQRLHLRKIFVLQLVLNVQTPVPGGRGGVSGCGGTRARECMRDYGACVVG